MYLSDNDIRAALDEIQFVAPDETNHPFVPDDQIQPCSVDLRLSNIFWVPKPASGLQFGRQTVDLRKSLLLDLEPHHLWKRRELKEGEYITLRPGELLLGRTYERFTIPRWCGGKIEGKSSYSRLGLSIHCTGDFMNPLYSGHMTLQLVNHSKQDIRISPFIPIAQLFFIKLTSPPQNAYGEGGLQHKYMNDDGGPSFWWRDKRIKQLHAQLRKFDVSLQMEKELIDRIGGIRVSIIRRFWKYLEKTKIGQAESSDAVIERFLQKEKRSKAFNIARIALGVAFFPTMIGIALTMEFKDLGQTWFLVTTLISIIYFGHTCANYDLNFLTEEMLAENKQGQKE